MPGSVLNFDLQRRTIKVHFEWKHSEVFVSPVVFSFSFSVHGCDCGIWKFPGLGVELEQTGTTMLDPSLMWYLCHSLQQYRVLVHLSEARDGTHVLMDTMLVS